MPEDENRQDHEVRERQQMRRQKIRKRILLVFVGLILISFVLNVVLLCKVYRLEQKISGLYSNITREIADGGFVA